MLTADFDGAMSGRLANAGQGGRRSLGGRRKFLLQACALGGLTRHTLLSASEAWGLAFDARAGGFTTSSADFFVRNHFNAPIISSDSWALEVKGLVSSPVRLSYSDLLLMSSVRRAVTVECAGNPPGGTLVGTSEWSGVPLAAVLRQAEIRPSASTVVLHGADSGDGADIPPSTHFARAIPIDKAMDPSTLLVYEMNGGPLPVAHGFPVRALVAGWYGMDSVKWLTRIEVIDQPFTEYFQKEEYMSVRGNGERQPITRMSVNSKMLRPSEGEEIRSRTYRVEGVAWAGDRKIAKVQVRIDGSGDWQTANLRASLAAMVWTSWSYDWQLPRSGKHTIEVRAIDAKGEVQPEAREPDRKDLYQLNTPHRVSVNVLP